MKRHKILHRNTVRPRGGRLLHTFPSILLVLSLGLGSFVSSGCVAIPAVMMTSAAVTAVAVVSEGEKLVQNPDTESSMVAHETEADSRRGASCHRPEALPEETSSGTRSQHEARNHSAADLNEPRGGGDPNRPRT
jgi:hypothetical protein